jgi:ubiquilin
VDKKYEFTVPVTLTVVELKDKIAAESDVPATSQRLIYSGRVLKDQDTLEHYKIKSGHTIHLVKSANSNARAAPAASATSTNTSTSTSNTNASGAPSSNNNNGLPSNLAAGQGAFNPLAGLTDARYAGYGPALPSESMFGPDGGMQLPNEQDLDRMMENPMVQQGMNEMLRNPQMLDYFINQNPQLREMGPQVREMLQSDSFRQMMSNPQMLRQAREMSRMFGGGGANAFGQAQQPANSMPAPGSMNDDDDNDNNAAAASNTSTDTTSNTTPAANANAANPFSALFGAGGVPGGAGANPFAMFGPPPGAGSANAGNANAALPQFDPSVFQNLFGGAGAGGAGFGSAAAAAAPQDDRPPEVRYESQLRQLNDMGFFDFDSNVTALRRSGGSVQGAIEHLLGGV